MTRPETPSIITGGVSRRRFLAAGGAALAGTFWYLLFVASLFSWAVLRRDRWFLVGWIAF